MSQMQNQVVTLLKQTISRLDESEKEGADGIHDILGLLCLSAHLS
jgi:hypothetical protein